MPLDKTNIVLIGMPASGKSTVGVQLAKWLSMGFMSAAFVTLWRDAIVPLISGAAP